MARIKIDRNRCKGCGLCKVHCPRGLIFMDEVLNDRGVHPALFKDNGKCTGCMLCALVCPDVAIEVYK